MYWTVTTNKVLLEKTLQHCFHLGLLSICGWARSQPVREDVTYVTSSLIGLDLAQRCAVKQNNKNVKTTTLLSLHKGMVALEACIRHCQYDSLQSLKRLYGSHFDNLFLLKQQNSYLWHEQVIAMCMWSIIHTLTTIFIQILNSAEKTRPLHNNNRT